MDFERLYRYRHRKAAQPSRDRVWEVIAADLFRRMESPRVVLDLGCGRGEFISGVPAQERWAVDRVVDEARLKQQGVDCVITGEILEVELPEDYFDGILLSNVLEHFDNYDSIFTCLTKMRRCLRPNGLLAVLGPNFRYLSKRYFDCADHVIALSHVSIAEHVYAAGFDVGKVVPRYLPFSFRGLLPPSPALTGLYLRSPWAWPVLGKQFLVLGRCPADAGA